MNRRQVITAIGSGSVVGLGGCSTIFGSDVELLYAYVTNFTQEVQTVRIRITLDDDVIEELSDDFEASASIILDCTWPSEPGQFTIGARFEDEDEWTERDLTEVDSDCARAIVVVDSGIADTGDEYVGVLARGGCDPPGEPC